MSDLHKYKKVNWIDGMKINKDHFIALENYFAARINDQFYQQLNNNNFGLLPIKDEPEKSPDIKIVTDNQNEISVKIDRCHGITPGGYRIEISAENKAENEFILRNVETIYKQAAEQNDRIFLVISINPFSRIPFGDADPEEFPLRIPYVMPEYKLHLIPVKQINAKNPGKDMFIIAKMNIVKDKPEIDESYIPPCTSIDSHLKLIEFYEFIYKNISALETNCVKIIYDINEKQDENILTGIVKHITGDLLNFLSNNIPGYKWFLRAKPPIYVFEFIVKIARLLKNSFDSRTAEEKEVLLNYFSEYFDIVPSRFKQLLDNTIGLAYDHTEIYSIVEKCEDFMNVISVLFNELSKMELISGKKKKEEPKRIDIILR